MGAARGPHDLVGRDALLARLHAVLDRVERGEPASALVAGQAGMGKTSLLRAALAGRDAHAAWGTCVDIDGAPGHWPWTQALDGLVHRIGAPAAGAAAGDDLPVLASIVPAFGPAAPAGEGSTREQLLLADAVSRFLARLAAERPVVLVLDDLQWADASSLVLLDVVSRAGSAAPVAVLGAFRHDELSPPVRAALAPVVARSEHIELGGLDVEAVGSLVEAVVGGPVPPDVAQAVHRRTGGLPFFVRELAPSLDDGAVPTAVRDAIDRRVDRLPTDCVPVLEVAALLVGPLLPDVVATALGRSVVDVDAAVADAVGAGFLVPSENGARFAHDLLREAIAARLAPRHRTELHRRIATALEARHDRGATVSPSEVAQHLVAAVALDGPERAVRWSRAAAAADREALAFAEAATRLRRLRVALADAALSLPDEEAVALLVEEADALASAGNPVEARGLLRLAGDGAERTGDPAAVAAVALAIAGLGARFAVRRDDVVAVLDRARTLVAGADDRWDARVTATLARQLQHSVADERARAGPLSEQALATGRRTGDAPTLLACLGARHDVLWTPGTGAARAEVAEELAEVARRCGDDERRAEGLLLLANALLEQGSARFRTPLEESLAIARRLGQPRHRYTIATRRACVALVEGRLEEAEALVEEATALGERIREPDTGNVRMSQRLELVRARCRPDELLGFADASVDHWTGAPLHAHAVAAGFCARAGDPDGARRHVAAVLDLGTWRTERSYLWSVFVRELAVAAVAIDERDLMAELLDELLPLAGSCGVNGAVVAFAGSHGHAAGLLARGLGRDDAGALLAQAADAYRRLGATGWLAELEGARAEPTASPGPAMRRSGATWELRFAGRTATVPHSKGLADLARLVDAPGTDVHVLDLVGDGDRSGPAGEVVDRAALEAYRRRLADLDDDLDEAERMGDGERRARAELERQALLDELGRVTGTGGRPRTFANHPAERARKAVTGRIRDAIRRLEPVHPELAAHLEERVVTGTRCRYRLS